MSEHAIPDTYRIMRDGNGTHWIEEEHTTFFLRRKVWRPMLKAIPYWDGCEYSRRTFDTKEGACTWLRGYLDAKAARELHEANAKLRIPAGPCW